jgi:diguanylate cyclase (GGDEF)-like protein
MAISVLCLLSAAVLFLAGDRMPYWTLYAGGLISAALITACTAIGLTGHVNFATFYIWLIVYAALYYSPLATLACIALTGTAYAVLLVHVPAEPNRVSAWCTVFGAAIVAGVVVLVLVGALRADARKDPLTGLPNRRGWEDRIEEELQRAQRTGAPLSVAMIDVDDFKSVNDHQGHYAGDALLRALSTAWQDVVRGGGDFLARLGGDEFALLAPGSDADGIRQLADRIARVAPEGVTYSIGTASWNGRDSSGDLMRWADQAMFEQKRSHRKCPLGPSPRDGLGGEGRRRLS